MLFFVFCIVYFGGYPVLQFDPRHYFYLEFMHLWCLGFFAVRVWRAGEKKKQIKY